MTPMVATYSVYLFISLAITFWVGRTLFTNGRIFLIEIFAGNISLADAVNRLLLVGYYLVNAAFVTLTLRTAERSTNLLESIEMLGTKVGLVLTVLGGMHFFNLVVFSHVRRAYLARPPVA
ncbi:MAG: hypothetical protein VB859_13090 [Planctomycetaceae bacterium]